MKRNDTHWDLTKKEFYDEVRNKKQELEEVIQEAGQKGYVDFDAWYLTEYNWRFLRDLLGGQKAMGVAPFDYCNLIHQPKFQLTDGKEKLMSGIIKGGENITITYNEDDKIPTFIIDSTGSGRGEWGYITGDVHNQTDVQPKVYYGQSEPAEAYDGDLWMYTGGSSGSATWGDIEGDILKQLDLQESLSKKQNAINETNKLSYSLLKDLPSIAEVQIEANKDITLDDIDVYNKTDVKTMVATIGGDYLGSNYNNPTTEDYSPESRWEEASELIYDQIGTVAKKNDWCYIVRKDTDDKLYYQRWMCSGETKTVGTKTFALFKFLFEVEFDVTELQTKVTEHTTQIADINAKLLTKADEPQYISLNGASGDITEEQITLLQSNLLNYVNTANALGLRLIWWDGDSTTGYMVYSATYYDDDGKAWAHKLTIDIANKTYTNERKELAISSNVDVKLATKQDVISDLDTIRTNAANALPATKCTYQTTAPASSITDGGVHIVYLTSEPSMKYDGYIYLIKEA